MRVVEMEFVGIIDINFSFKKFLKKGRIKLGWAGGGNLSFIQGNGTKREKKAILRKLNSCVIEGKAAILKGSTLGQ